SAADCADGSPVDPPSEIPCEPDSSCQRIRFRSPSRSGAPSAANGETTGAIDPRIWAGSLRNRIGLLLSFGFGPLLALGQPLSTGKPRLVGGLPPLDQGEQAVDGLALCDHRGGEFLP